jgi:hypothetical protein
MAKKKTTAQQRDIERLAKDYQSSLMGLDPEYQSIFGEKTKALEGFSAQTAAFQKKLEDYQASLAEYKKNPFEDQKIRGSFEPYGKTYEWGYVIDGTWRSAKNLPEGYVEESPTGDFALKKKSVPKFAVETPVAPDTEEFDAQIEQVKAKQKSLGEGYTRELAERKAGRVGAITQRAQSRPMLSKGVTL